MDKENSFKSNDAFLIPYITLLGYACAFLFEASYASFFGIPYYFVSIGLENIVFSILTVLFVLTVVLGIATTLDGFRIFTNTFYGRLRALIAAEAIIVTPMAFLGEWNMYFIFISLLLSALILFEFVLPLILGRREKGFLKKRALFLEKIKASKERDVANSKNSLLALASKRFRILPVEIVILSFLLIFIPVNSGYLIAKYQKFFYVSNSLPETILVRKYADLVFTVPLNPDRKSFSSQLIILTEADLASNSFSYRLLGVLEQDEMLKTRIERSGGLPLH